MHCWNVPHHKGSKFPNDVPSSIESLATRPRYGDQRARGSPFSLSMQPYHRCGCRIIDDSPWSFDGHLLLTHELQQGETPNQVALNTVAFWIQVHNLPHRYFSEEAGRAIGNDIGSFLDYDERNANFLPDAYMRIRIAMDVRVPLLQETHVLVHNNSELTCPLKSSDYHFSVIYVEF
ncbi:hypothetical protein LINGRAHAP2_LOCUS4181 [Linum grandiflorum]